jgi:putative transport protein
MRWYEQLITGTSVAGVLTGLSVAVAAGLALGSVKVKGLSLGVTGVLFTGIVLSDVLWGHAVLARMMSRHALGGGAETASLAAVEQGRREMLELLREIGLVLFVYSIGLQVGPGFSASLRAQGKKWNGLAVGLVVMNVIAALAVHRWCGIDRVATVGLLSGAVTNTPGLAAAEQALRDIPGLGARERGLAAVGCAVAYPFGVIGAILTLVLVRAAFRVDPRREAALFRDATRGRQSIGNIDLRVANPALAGQRVGSLSHLLGAPVVVSRLMRQGQVEPPSADTLLEAGDLIHAVGEDGDLERLAILSGERSDVDVRGVAGRLGVRRLVVTRSEAVGRTLGALELSTRHGINVTRVLRAGFELVPSAGFELHFGDTLVVVGENEHLAEVEVLVGNSVGELEHAQLVPVFLGIAAGVLVGSIPIAVGGLPAPLRLGLAGGPLLVALLASHLGRLGRVSFYLPNSANLMLRDFGIVLFLGSVGLLSGERFVETLLHGQGARWMLVGAVMTLAPLLVIEVIARLALKMDYTAICGVVAGGMTSPPVLAFADQAAGDAAAVAYGAVYPLTMILRVVSAQLLVILWVGSSG